MNAKTSRITGIALALGILFQSTSVHALSRDVKTVMTTAVYGAAGGAVVGLVSYPLVKQPRNIGIGASVGLYLGIVVGLYHVMNRDDPSNPLRVEKLLPQDQWEPAWATNCAAKCDEDREGGSGTLSVLEPERPLVHASFEVLSF